MLADIASLREEAIQAAGVCGEQAADNLWLHISHQLASEALLEAWFDQVTDALDEHIKTNLAEWNVIGELAVLEAQIAAHMQFLARFKSLWVGAQHEGGRA